MKVDRIRLGAWLALLALAGAQAWSSRFYVTPDGVSYMDLSDAVLTGEWRELLNAYWSPLYPFLIGILRAITRATPYWEFAVVHLLNLMLFAASLAGFEYLLAPLRELGRTRWDKPGLDTTWGRVAAYSIFGVFTLTMTPLILPTPDLLVSAACLFVFGALLRLRYNIAPGRAAVVLGVALAVGSLAKSFIIPWAGICLIVAVVALAGRSRRPAAIAWGIWLVAVIPWTVGLSMKYGHVTFGDTGRLTYTWFVNQVETPSHKIMPSGAAAPGTSAILGGVAVTPNAPGTNPTWYDPARWYGGLKPHFELSRQVEVFAMLIAEYIASLAPVFLVLVFWLIAAGRDGIREWWSRTWPVTFPALAALGAYSMVLVTTRYVAPFYMALVLVVTCGARWPDRISPTRMLLAIGVPLIFMIATPEPGRPVAMVNAAVGAVLFTWAFRHRGAALQVGIGLAGILIIRLLQPFSDLRYVWIVSVLLILLYWAMARTADRQDEWAVVSPHVRRSLVAANALLVIFVATLKYIDSLRQELPDRRQPNDNWFAAGQAASVGITAGSKVALVGSPFEAYWARVARAKIVAVVPPPRMGEFNGLAPDRRGRLYEEFAKAGADFVVVQQANPPEGNDRSWSPVQYIGWVKRLR